MMTQGDMRFGYIRISKNGSTAISSIKEFELDEWTLIKGFGGNIYAAIRNPIDRFISSIPETLFRYRCLGSSKTCGGGWKDVLVSYDIYECLKDVRVDSVINFINDYISVIVECGYFDAHHEPQINFMFDRNMKAYSNNIYLFELSRVDFYIKMIANKEGVCLPEGYEVCAKNIGIKDVGMKNKIRDAVRRVLNRGNLNISKYYNSYSDNPMYRWGVMNGVSFENVRGQLYKSLLEEKRNQDLIGRISELYDSDCKLYRCVQKAAINSKLYRL